MFRTQKDEKEVVRLLQEKLRLEVIDQLNDTLYGTTLEVVK